MTLLLVIIYLAFISLGLPDAMLGSAWPVMYEGFGVALSGAGIVSMIISAGTIVSSLFSERFIKRFGTGVVTLVSVAMTAVALLGISFCGSFPLLCLWAVPLGLGAGSVDAALNNFVALHYKASHMSWLHCFWGIGASAGPVIMSYILATSNSWATGYRLVGGLQMALVVILLLSLPLWKRVKRGEEEEERSAEHFGLAQLINLPGAKATLVAFFCYCSIELTVGLWGSTFLVSRWGISPDKAAGWISLFYAGITVGRLLSGFVANRLSSIGLLRLGQGMIALGVVLIVLPVGAALLPIGFFSIGLGCAPIFPTLLHETPNSFGKQHSQAIMGLQMATAYAGTTVMPPLLGWIGGVTGYGIFPYFVGFLLLLMAFCVQYMLTRLGQRKKSEQ